MQDRDANAVPARLRIARRAISNPSVLGEAYSGPKPLAYSRGMRVDFEGMALLFISGTYSADDQGRIVHAGDLRRQTRRIFEVITSLLSSEACTWKDVVRTTCYLRDIDRDYEAFNEVRTAFYCEQGLDPLPASTGIQAKMFSPEVLVEIEAIAIIRTTN